jgi:ribosomal protein S18 acetylase RimI-like enzyme
MARISEHAVELARISDAPRIAAMSRDYIEAGLGWKWTAGRVRKCLRDPATNVIVVRESGVVAGFAIMQYGDDEAHLVLLAVEVARRRRGIGTALIRWLESTALTAGIGVVYLEARSRNGEARGFYRRHGYAEVARVPRMYRGVEDGLRIAKDLWEGIDD